jgi:hypothetical protein
MTTGIGGMATALEAGAGDPRSTGPGLVAVGRSLARAGTDTDAATAGFGSGGGAVTAAVKTSAARRGGCALPTVSTAGFGTALFGS